eukprot:TRINITY_DN15693_c0_g1_i1.p2 TRINITY_DN15693_c0_g1~~TRINITY_DN15693_c0_g1_i1.p2  ORF type:complete len:127 (+),score=8.56 TRINITY_DN15693_c0_g1_i1:128-508(+)
MVLVLDRYWLRRLYAQVYEEQKDTPNGKRITDAYEKGKAAGGNLAKLDMWTEREPYIVASMLEPSCRKCLCWSKGCCFPLYGLWWLTCVPFAASCNQTWGLKLEAGCCDFGSAECRALKQDKAEYC